MKNELRFESDTCPWNSHQILTMGIKGDMYAGGYLTLLYQGTKLAV